MKKIIFLFLSVFSFGFSNEFVNFYINEEKCDQILTYDGKFLNCYNYNTKGIEYGYIKLVSSVIDKNKIKREYKFKPDGDVSFEYRSTLKDYKNDRNIIPVSIIGVPHHLDYSKRAVLNAYLLSNALPLFKDTEYTYNKLNTLIRTMVRQKNELNVLFTVNEGAEYLGQNKINIPKSISIYVYNDDFSFKRCFVVPNDNQRYTPNDLIVSCSSIGFYQ